MRKMNVSKLINKLLEVKEKAGLNYVHIDENKGNDLITVIDDVSDRLGDFCNGIVILSALHDDMYDVKIYTQLTSEQQEIFFEVLRPEYCCDTRSIDDNVLYAIIFEKGEYISFSDMYRNQMK